MEIKFDTYSFRARVLPVYLTLAPARATPSRSSARGTQAVDRRSSSLGLRPDLVLVQPSRRGLRKMPREGPLGEVGEDLRRLAFSGTATMSSTRSRAVAFTPSSANLGSTFRLARSKSKTSALQTRTMSHAPRNSFGGRGTPEGSRSSSRGSPSTASAETCSAEGLRRVPHRRRGRWLGLVDVHAGWTATNELPAVSLVAGLITAGLLLAWLVWITERTVKFSADRYARFILEAAWSSNRRWRQFTSST